MAEFTVIGWCHHTFNMWAGCTRVSPACEHCYAAASYSIKARGIKWGKDGNRVRLSDTGWKEPTRWDLKAARGDCPTCNGGRKKITDGDSVGYAICPTCEGRENIGPHRRRVFCASLADVFEDWQGPILHHKGEQLAYCPCGSYTQSAGYQAPICSGCHDAGSTRPATMDDVRGDLFELIDRTPNLDWLLLTKRPENIGRMWPFDTIHAPDALPYDNQKRFANIWLGTTVESSAYLHRIDHLLQNPAPVHFVSNEPAFERVDFRPYLGPDKVNWVITGGESKQGKDHSPAAYNVEIARSIIGQCRAFDVAPYVKQLGSNPVMPAPNQGRRFGASITPMNLKHPKGEDPTEWPAFARIQEFPLTTNRCS